MHYNGVFLQIGFMREFSFTVRTLEHWRDPALVGQVIFQVFYMLVGTATQVWTLDPRIVNRTTGNATSVRWPLSHEHYKYEREQKTITSLFNIRFVNELTENQYQQHVSHVWIGI